MDKKSRPTEEYIQQNRESIGKQIRLYREKKGISQEELAEMLEIKNSTISKIENGKFAITIDYLAKLAWYLDFDISTMKKKEY
jgi:transcriptional regulator with XRE-family HTH domain